MFRALENQFNKQHGIYHNESENEYISEEDEEHFIFFTPYSNLDVSFSEINEAALS